MPNDPPVDPGRQRSIVLLGFMAVGKSTIGRKLAGRLDLPFSDSDQLIEEKFGCSVDQIFLKYGEAEFRSAEREVIRSLMNRDAHVISIGGGAFLDPVTRNMLNSDSVTVWLDAPFDLIVQRLDCSSTRPLAVGKTTSEIRQMWEERRKCYAEAQFRVAASQSDPENVVDRVLEAFGADS